MVKIVYFILCNFNHNQKRIKKIPWSSGLLLWPLLPFIASLEVPPLSIVTLGVRVSICELGRQVRKIQSITILFFWIKCEGVIFKNALKSKVTAEIDMYYWGCWAVSVFSIGFFFFPWEVKNYQYLINVLALGIQEYEKGFSFKFRKISKNDQHKFSIGKTEIEVPVVFFSSHKARVLHRWHCF